EVRARFQPALALERRIALLAELSGQERQVVASTRARVRDQSVTPLTGRLTELDGLRVGARELEARAQYRQAIVALAAAMGGTLTERLSLVGEPSLDSLSAPEDSVVSRALRRRLEFEALRLRTEDRRADLHVARVEARPDLILGLGVARD